MTKGMFLWGTFSFIKQSYETHAASPGLSRSDVEQIIKLLGIATRKAVRDAATSSRQGEVVGVLVLGLGGSRFVGSWAFNTGQDAAKRPGAYAIHGIIENGENPVARLRQMISNGELRAIWNENDIEQLRIGNFVGSPQVTDDSQRNKALEWVESLDDSCGILNQGHGIAIINGELQHIVGEYTDNGIRKIKRSLFLILTAFACLLGLGLGWVYWPLGDRTVVSAPEDLKDEDDVTPPLVPSRWIADVNKSVAWCDYEWELGVSVDPENDHPGANAALLLKALAETTPREDARSVFEDWKLKSTTIEVPKACGAIDAINRICDRVEQAANQPMPSHDTYDVTMKYLVDVTRVLSGNSDVHESSDIVLEWTKILKTHAESTDLRQVRRIINEDNEISKEFREQLLTAYTEYDRFIDTLR